VDELLRLWGCRAVAFLQIGFHRRSGRPRIVGVTVTVQAMADIEKISMGPIVSRLQHDQGSTYTSAMVVCDDGAETNGPSVVTGCGTTAAMVLRVTQDQQGQESQTE
jgi:hypothetical protein